MSLFEPDIRSKIIDPFIHKRGWTGELIRREDTAGAVEMGGRGTRRRPAGGCAVLFVWFDVSYRGRSILVVMQRWLTKYISGGYHEQFQMPALRSRSNKNFV